MKQIKIHGKLGNGKFAIVSDSDYELINRYRWNLDTDGYAIATKGRHKMHRLIVAAGPKNIVDHINGNRLDNRIENLRLVNAQQNAQNCKSAPGASGYRGVNRGNSKSESWEACISHNNKQIYLGSFKTAKEAAKAYNKKAIELRGEFAVLNKL